MESDIHEKTKKSDKEKLEKYTKSLNSLKITGSNQTFGIMNWF